VVPYKSDSEREIAEAVHAVRAGRAQAYATIVERFQGPVMTVCAAIVRNRQAAEELAQDVFVRAYQRLETFDVRRPMKPWLVKIAYHLAQQRWRGRVRETAHAQVAATILEQNRSDRGPADNLLVDERSAMLWQAVYALPMAQRTAVVLYYREGLTVEEVAKAMGLSPGTIKTHLFRARAQIEISLRAKGFDEGDIA